jgi:hypothetical protein
VYIKVFLTSSLLGGDWSDSRPGRFNLEEETSGNRRFGLQGGPDDMGK